MAHDKRQGHFVLKQDGTNVVLTLVCSSKEEAETVLEGLNWQIKTRGQILIGTTEQDMRLDN